MSATGTAPAGTAPAGTAPAGTAAGGRLRRAGVAVRRTALVPGLVRLVAALAMAATTVLAAPAGLLAMPFSLATFAVAAAATVGLFPRTRWVGIFLFAVVLEWLVGTLGMEATVGPVRLGLLAACVYLTHAAAGLAAVLPYDCLVAWRVVWSWAARMLTVLVVGVGVGLGGLVLTGLLPAARSVVGPIIGSVVAAGLAGLLAWHARRR